MTPPKNTPGTLNTLGKDLISTKRIFTHFHLSLLTPLIPSNLTILPSPVLLSSSSLHTSPRSGRRDKLSIMEQSRTSKRTFKQSNRGENESRSNLHEGSLGWTGRLERIFFDDLEVSEPDFVIEDGKEEDVVDEWFESTRGFRYREYLTISLPLPNLCNLLL